MRLHHFWLRYHNFIFLSIFVDISAKSDCISAESALFSAGKPDIPELKKSAKIISETTLNFSVLNNADS